MDNLDDSENNAKISDSGYSNSCSNSQSRRSHSSKSTHSGSNSSGSSGYGGQTSSPDNCDGSGQQQKKEKDSKKKKPLAESIIKGDEEEAVRNLSPEVSMVLDLPKEECDNAVSMPSPVHVHTDRSPKSMDLCTSDKISAEDGVPYKPIENSTFDERGVLSGNPCVGEGFSCVISMDDGVVMYTTISLTHNLGFPKDMWIGRSFIDFLHQKDRTTFASQITSCLAVPKVENGKQETAPLPGNTASTIVCRIRKYRGLSSGYGVRDQPLTYIPFLLKLTLREINDEDTKTTYLVVQASPFYSAFTTPNQVIVEPVPFVMRHTADGTLEFIDHEAVPYLGYLPQDLEETNALLLFHQDDLHYLTQVYQAIVREGALGKCRPYRIKAQNGHYVKVETEWSSFINPWSRKLEFVIGKHFIKEGPTNPDVFQAPEPNSRYADYESAESLQMRGCIIRIMNEVLTKPAEMAKQHMTKRCQDVASFMESLVEEPPKLEEEPRIDLNDTDHSYFGSSYIYYSTNSVQLHNSEKDRDSVMLGGISPHHEYNDSMSSSETPLSYNQLNYNRNLKRYFESQPQISCQDYKAVEQDCASPFTAKHLIPPICPSPTDDKALEFSEESSSYDSSNLTLPNDHPSSDCPPVRLTEELLSRHNTEMERELMQSQRESRPVPKIERALASNAKRQKKKEHLARCNAAFQPTAAIKKLSRDKLPIHGIKRNIKQKKHTDCNSQKYFCPPSRTMRRNKTPKPPLIQQCPTNTVTTTSTVPWPSPGSSGHVSPYFMGVGVHQPVPVMTAVPGMYPMYYIPTTKAPEHLSSAGSEPRHQRYQPPAMPCVVYAPTVNGAPFVYAPVGHPIDQPMGHPVAQSMGHPVAQSMDHPVAQSMGHPVAQSMGHPVAQSMGHPVAHSMGHPVAQSMGHPVGQSMEHSVSQSHPVVQLMGHPVNQPTDQTIGQPMGHPVRQQMGHPVGQPMGRPNGQPMEQQAGQPMGQLMSHPDGQRMGHPVGQAIGQMMGHPVGQAMSQMMGHPVAQPIGLPVGQLMGHPVGQPIGRLYSHPIRHPMNEPLPPRSTPASVIQDPAMNLALANRNYEEVCKLGAMKKLTKPDGPWVANTLYGLVSRQAIHEVPSGSGLLRSTEATVDSQSSDEKSKSDNVDTSSSCYSSFLRTDSGSAEDSGDGKKFLNRDRERNWELIGDDSTSFHSSGDNASYEPLKKKVTRKRLDAPWMKKVCLTSELVYKYKVNSRPKEEVLLADKEKLARFAQPDEVNEQLDQLYLDLQLEGVASRLTLEEGITSSSSSGEENSCSSNPRKREYNKLVVIYEEDAPLPSPPSAEDPESQVESTS